MGGETVCCERLMMIERRVQGAEGHKEKSREGQKVKRLGGVTVIGEMQGEVSGRKKGDWDES